MFKYIYFLFYCIPHNTLSDIKQAFKKYILLNKVNQKVNVGYWVGHVKL